MAAIDVYRSALIDKAEKDVDAERTPEAEEDFRKVDWSDMSVKNQEKTRALRKKYDLQQKLKVKQAAQAPELTEEERQVEKERKERETAEAAAEAVRKIEDATKPKEEIKDGEKVKLGSKMLINSEGNMSKEDSMRLQAAVGTGKSSKLKAFFQLEGQKREIGEEDVNLDEVITFSGCKNCEFTVTAGCTKLFVEHCENFILRLQGKIITQTVEIDACEKMNLLSYVKMGTLQVERCNKMNIIISEKDNFRDGFMIWAGTSMLKLQVEDASIMCDFDLTKKLDKTINRERTQFKVWLNSQDRLSCDKIIRLQNGFPTTKREDDEHVRREEAKLADLAKRMGVTVNRKQESIGGRVKPNEPCPCGSGQKYKKCCLNGTTRLAPQM
eukprot:TRINITY_DN50963_c0_g1_i1.p1 TRINITY_DN50963_c0_g1~~TRINITY_DN50963_c0_g1_i1.p1  ORF type:complete len:392 (+),score=127.82 TRINITY_DN50963_c0_g1_i1:25-1176(+)